MTIHHICPPTPYKTCQQLPSASSLVKYFKCLEKSALHSEVASFYRGRNTALLQEISGQSSIFDIDGCHKNTQSDTLDALLAIEHDFRQHKPDIGVTQLDATLPLTSQSGLDPATGGEIRVCRRVAYYAEQQQHPSQARVRKYLDFAVPPPGHCVDMRREADRLLTFQTQACPAGVTQAELMSMATSGLYYAQGPAQIKCAFCSGTVEGFNDSPVIRHRVRYSTCPAVLGLYVGNVPAPPTNQLTDQLKPPVQCSEAPDVETTPVVMARENAEFRRCLRESVVDDAMFGGCAIRKTATPALAQLKAAELQATAGALQPGYLLPPRHPAFTDHAARLASLQASWYAGLAPVWLVAKAGFHCPAATAAGQSEAVCFSCGITLPGQLLTASDAAASACPWELHARLSPGCPHLLRERGSNYVASVCSASPPFRVLRLRSCTESDPKLGLGLGPHRRSCLLRTTSLAAALVRYRLDRRAVRARLDLPASRLVASLLLRRPDDADAGGSVEPSLRLQLLLCGDDFRSGECQLEATWHLAEQAAGCGLRAAATLAADWEAAAEKRRRLVAESLSTPSLERGRRRPPLCRRCGVSATRVCALPCGHCCLCGACEPAVDACPVCFQEIEATCLFIEA